MQTRETTPAASEAATLAHPRHVPPGTPPVEKQPTLPSVADAVADRGEIEYASWLQLLRRLAA